MERNLLNALKDASDRIRRHVEGESVISIVSHRDADGVAAAGILGAALLRLDSPFRIRVIRGITERVVDQLKEEEAPIIVFIDLGSGYLDLIKERLEKTEVVILDHHKPVNTPVPRRVAHVNPRLFGFDKGYEISGAGITYLLSRALSEENDDLSWLAVVGALGDLQDRNRRLHSINRIIAERAARKGLLDIATDLVFYGRETRPLSKSLAYTTNPFLPGLSGREDRCVALLQDSGIRLKEGGRWRTLSDLSTQERRDLLAAIAKFLAPMRIDLFKLIGEVYTLLKEEPFTLFRDAREYSSLLSACSRMERQGLAVSICLGSRTGALKEAESVVADCRKRLAGCIEWVMEGNIKKLENVYVIDGRGVIGEDFIGTVTSIVASIFPDKVVIGLANADEEDDLAKVSARASESLAKSDVNVGEVIINAAESVKGRGGGHEAAAGAYIPQAGGEEFIRKCNQLLGAL